MISMIKPTTDDSPSMGPGLPDRYNIKSELTFDVPADGSDAANFDLDSKQASREFLSNFATRVQPSEPSSDGLSRFSFSRRRLSALR